MHLKYTWRTGVLEAIMELLLERVQGRTESRVETMHPVLVARGSTRPA